MYMNKYCGISLSLQTDWELHRAFFECIVDVATLLRHHSLPILEPLLQQVSERMHF